MYEIMRKSMVEAHRS